MSAPLTLGEVFRQWIMAQHIEGYEITRTDETHLRLDGTAFFGEANFYRMGDEPEIAELRVTRRADDEYMFFLHFVLEDIARAQELFDEMREALLELAEDRRVSVLLCCTCGITTTMFATKMGQLSDALGLGYDVWARPLDAALAAGEAPDVVMLAPQVAYERARVAEAFPQAVVFEIPAKVYGSYDAAAGVRLIANALDGHNRGEERPADTTRLPDDLAWDGCIMVVSSVLGSRQSSFEYRVFDHGEAILTGSTAKRSFDFRDIEDLLAGVRLRGVDISHLDAIGIAVPGIVDDEAVSLFLNDVHDYDLGGHIQQVYGVPVYLDNDANPSTFMTLAGGTQWAMAAICLAVWLRTRDTKEKQVALPSFFSALFGVTEPAMYGVALNHMPLFVLVCIAGGIGGLIAGLGGITMYNYAGMGLIGLLGYINPNGATPWLAIILQIVVPFAIAFLGASALYKQDDKRIEMG